MHIEKYENRQEAGKILASKLAEYANRKDVIVLGLPRGGVPVAFEIAQFLHAPLDVFVVRKLGVPSHTELAMGAVAPNGVVFLNQDIIDDLTISKDQIEAVIMKETQELARREMAYRGTLAFPNLQNKIVILVDDGIATGATMQAAVQALQQLHPAKIIIAVPVADKMICDQLGMQVEKVICAMQPEYLHAVGVWYEDFSQTEDEEVQILLQANKKMNENDVSQ